MVYNTPGWWWYQKKRKGNCQSQRLPDIVIHFWQTEPITISGKRWLRQFPSPLLLLPQSSSSFPNGVRRRSSSLVTYHLPSTSRTFTSMEPADPRSTPSGRSNYLVSFSEKDKQRVNNADPNGGLCLVTNGQFPIEYCHCIPRAIINNPEIVCAYKS